MGRDEIDIERTKPMQLVPWRGTEYMYERAGRGMCIGL